MQRFHITNYIIRQRPDTKWKPYLITNVRIVIYHLNFVLGNVGIILPPHISKSEFIVQLTKDRIGQTYTDNLCAFRCLAVHQGYYPTGVDSRTIFFISAVGLISKSSSKRSKFEPQNFPWYYLKRNYLF